MSEKEPETDRAIFAEAKVRRIFTENFTEAFQQSTVDPAWGGAGCYRGRGASGWSELPSRLWQGKADEAVTPAMGRYMARQMPSCRARFLPGEDI